MPIEAAVINAADAAEMSSPTGGTGTLSLVEISGKPKLRDKWSTGVHPVPYAAKATNGMREWAIGNYNADTDQLERPSTVLSWAPGVGYATTKVAFPTSGVTIGFSVTVGMYNQIQADLQSLAADIATFTTSLAGKANSTHGHAIADVTGLQAALDALAGGEGGGVVDGDRGDITVASGGTAWTIDAGAVNTTKMGGDVTTAGKALLTAADAAAQRTALALGSAALQAASAFAAASHGHAATDLTSGTVPTARMPALTGDVTMAAGTTETAIPPASIATAKLGVDISTAGKSLLTAADAAAQRTTLGLGSAATQASSAFASASHAHSAADISSGTLGAARMPALTGDVTTSAGAVATTLANGAVTTAKMGGDVTTAGKALLTAADAAAQRTAIGAVIGTDVQAYSAKLAALVGLTWAADKLAYLTGAATAAVTNLTAFGRTLIGAADAAAARTALEIEDVSVAEGKLYGRGAGSGAGALQEITPGTGLSFAGTTLNATGGGGGSVAPGISGFRLTTEASTPISTTDRTAQGTLRLTPYLHNRMTFYSGGAWVEGSFSEITLALSGLTSGKNYDVFCDYNGGTPQLVLGSAWTNDTTRADALATQDGVPVKTGDTDHVYVGTIRTTGTTTTEDSLTKRYVWNAYNRVPRPMQVTEATASWTYTTNAWRAANGNTGVNRVSFVIGLAAVLVDVVLKTAAQVGGGAYAGIGIGIDTETAVTGVSIGLYNNNASAEFDAATRVVSYPGVGHHFASWNENGQGSPAGVTFYGSAISGLMATING